MLIAKFRDELFYSSSDEGDRLTGATNADKLEFPHLFWTVKDSQLVDEFKRQSAGVREADPIRHFCFMGCNQCVDVLSLSEPAFQGQENDF